MPGIDYSKWDKLEVSDDEDASFSPQASSDALPDDSAHGEGNGHTGSSDSDDLESEIRAEHAEVASFVQEHPCPSEAMVLEWLRDAVTKGVLDQSSQALKGVLDNMDLSSVALSMFKYASFKDLYEAPLQKTMADEKQVQRRVGAELNMRGGMQCMHLHYYMVNYAMCGSYFFGAVYRPMSVMCYINVVEDVWKGIGDWRGR